MQFLFLLASMLSGSAAAQEVRVVVTDPLIDAPQLQSDLQAVADDRLNVAEQEDFLRQMVQATALSSRGMGVDYASGVQKFVVGGSFGSALHGQGAGFGPGSGLLPSGGFAFQGAVMGGLNLGALALPESALRRFVIYGHGMASAGGNEPFSSRAVNGGAHLQVQALRVRDAGVAGWGGIALTTGYQYTAYTIGLDDTVPLTAGDTTWEAQGSYDIQARSHSIPLEVSTHMRTGPVTVFGGGGIDFITGGTGTSSVDLYGDLENDAGQSVGEALLTFDTSADDGGVVPRVFGGLQVNIALVKLYGQLNVALPEGFGGHFGVRLAM